MRPERRNLLEIHQMQLAEYMDIINVLDYLQASRILPDGVIESISNLTGLKARLELLKAVRARGDDAFNALFQAFKFSKQDNLAELLRPLAENNENKEETFCLACPTSTPNIRSRSISELVLQEGQFCQHQELNTLFHRTRTVSEKSLRDPTAWIDNDPMILAGELDLSVEGTDGYSIRDQVELWQKNSSNIYPNFSSPKGKCLIINNHTFATMPSRKGTEVDCKNVSNLFRQLGYFVILHKDLTAKEMLSAFCEFAQDKTHGQSLVVIVLTHGENQVFIGTDGEHLNINYVLSQFNSINSRHLTGKPKIFLFQACRGERYDYGVTSNEIEHTDGSAMYSDGFLSPFTCVMKQAKPQELRLPCESDFLIAYATVSDYVSWRNSLYGTWFIQAICEVFSRHARELDISEMMVLVNRRIAHGKSTAQMQKQTPEFSSRLRKKFYFFPGVSQPA